MSRSRDITLGLGFFVAAAGILAGLVGFIGAMWVDAGDIEIDAFDNVQQYCTDALREAGTRCANDTPLDNQLAVVGISGFVIAFVTMIIIGIAADL